ncbi:MAG TPA: UbiA family prenyltransferase, partial [Streptosporangiaceae bacterium]
MTVPTPAAKVTEPQRGSSTRLSAPFRWLLAVAQSTRPRQWPKNLLVFAAPLAGDTFGRAHGFWYALVAAAAFIAASSAVYLVNDVVDAERDRSHPYKRSRPVAAGRLPAAHAVVLAICLGIVALGAGLIIGEPLLAVVIAAYLAFSFLYSAGLKHVPLLELACVASGFVLRVVGGAAATHVPPSGFFLLVCSLGALMVAIAKRYTE